MNVQVKICFFTSLLYLTSQTRAQFYNTVPYYPHQQNYPPSSNNHYHHHHHHQHYPQPHQHYPIQTTFYPTYNPLVEPIVTPQQTFVQKIQPTSSTDIFDNNLNCGSVYSSDKLVGGNNTGLDEFPWMVLLEYRKGNGQLVNACGGMLINKRYILTAAHCLDDNILRRVGQLINIKLGEWNTDADPDCISYPDGRRDCSDAVVYIAPEEIIPHANFNINNMENDIGLVRLAHDVVYTDFIKPICMPSPQMRSNAGEKLVVSGWGKTTDSSRSSIKQKLSIDVNDQQTCTNKFALINQLITDSQLCAGGVFLEDSCSGDSGGPLMKLVNQKWFVEGIVSFGQKSCGTEGWPGIYTRVPSYVDWIRSNVKN